jgi:dTDP-glucose 4,6-dehydratase
MKNVLITGGAGFIAHHMVDYLLNNTDWNIITLDRLDFSGNLNRLHDLIQHNPERKRVRTVFHDLKAELNPMIASTIGKVDIILHLAAGSHVDRSIEYPMEFVMDNVVGSVNLMQYARKCDNLERFIYFSTDEVFGPAPQDIKYKEYDRYNSTNPYSASKAGGEEMAVAFHNTYKLPVYITHTMNVFGERQHPEKYIPMVIKKVRDGQSITVHSDSTKTIPGSRHYIHASDVADAIHHIINMNYDPNMNRLCPKFNIVGKQEINNLELAQLIADCQNKPLNYEMVDFHSSRPGHDLRYALCGDYMRSLGWEPKIELTDRIKQVVDWSLSRPDWLMK